MVRGSVSVDRLVNDHTVNYFLKVEKSTWTLLSPPLPSILYPNYNNFLNWGLARPLMGQCPFLMASLALDINKHVTFIAIESFESFNKQQCHANDCAQSICGEVVEGGCGHSEGCHLEGAA